MADTTKKSWSARVLIYEDSAPLEEVMFDSFLADSETTARNLAVEFGYGYMKTLDLDSKKSTGVRVIAVAPDVMAGTGKEFHAASPVTYGTSRPTTPAKSSSHNWTGRRVPFSCPIVQLCKVKYATIKLGGSFNAIKMADKAKET